MSEKVDVKNKIVFVLPDMPGGGTERVVSNLANKYVEWGYMVDILLFAGNTVEYKLDPKIHVEIVGEASKGNPFARISRIAKMRSYYRKNPGCNIFAFANMGCVFSVIAVAGVPHRLLVSERNDPSQVPWKHKVIRDWAYAKADKLVCQTKDVVGMFPDKLQRKSVVIQNPLSEDIPNPFEGVRSKKIVNVARLQPQKNHLLLLNAYSKFHEKHPDYTLEIYGQGDLKEKLKNIVDELGIGQCVTLHGFSSNVKEEIKDATMFVLSSDYEGISNSLTEAMAMGLPVISTDCPVGGSRALIEDGESGILTPVQDADALAEAMCKVAEDAGLAEKLSANAVKVREKYNLDNIAKQFLKAAEII